MEIKSNYEIEELLNSIEGLKQLNEYCEVTFKELNQIYINLKNRQVSSAPKTEETLDIITGLLGALQPVFDIVESIKENNEIKYYIDRKNQYEQGQVSNFKGEMVKFTSAAVEREAEAQVTNLNLLSNKIKGYLEQGKTLQGILQSKLKYYLTFKEMV